MNNIVIVSQGTGKYLFSVPDNVTLKQGDRVKCDTKRGITDGIAFADSAWVDENVSQLIGKLTGAKFPLKPVVGKLEYQPFDKPAGKPTEDKQEPVKLYCVKDSNPFGEVEFTKGTVCTFNPSVGALTLPDGRRVGSAGCPRSYDEWKADNPSRADCLVPLVARPAKVGESFLIVAKNGLHIPQVEIGNIFVAAKKGAHFGGKYVDTSNGNRFYDQKLEYLVLDGYHAEAEAEPELEPEYFSGKVVCVSSGDDYFAVGKMYEFINGEIKDDDGDERPVYADEQFKSVEEWNSEYGMPIARFIEFKGEAK